MSDILINEDLELDMRKKQALELNIDIHKDMTLESLEEEIVVKLESGMQDLKNILDEMNLLES